MSLARSRAGVHARGVLLLLVCFDTACRAPTEPPFPSNAVPMTPPPVYQLWWNLVERCSGLTGDFNAVRFYQEPGQSIATAGADSANAYWFAAGNRIVVGGLNLYAGPVLRHEMLHALLGAIGTNGHPHAYFVDKCGGIVHCSITCATEDGPLPVVDAGAPVISPRQLEVSVRMDPEQIDPRQYGGWMAVTVTATNPLATSAWVTIPAPPMESFGPTFGFSMAAGLAQSVSSYDTRAAFQAHETQRELFDVQLAPGAPLQPGQYDLRGYFATDTTAPEPVVVLTGH